MSSFVTTDFTVLAIVEGMKRYGFIGRGKRDFQDMAEALRGINEEMTAERYSESIEHTPVDISLTRDFTDGEVWKSCRCWLYQIDTGEPMVFEAITLTAAVRMLAEAIIEENLKNKTWKRKCYFGNYHYFELDTESETWGDIDDEVEWDLAA